MKCTILDYSTENKKNGSIARISRNICRMFQLKSIETRTKMISKFFTVFDILT